jgi:dienelactone hydrolase
MQLFKKYNAWMHKRLRLDSLCAPILLIVGLCPLSLAQSVRYETSVAPLPDEDIASSCHYELTIPSQVKKVMAVWVIFDRGRDVHELYSDEAVLQFAGRFRIALLLHGHCPGKRPEDHNDMDMDPSKGLGRALFAALDQFAAAAGHHELTRIPLIFLGFSGAGPLSARLVGSSPKRVLAAILSSPGHYEPLGIDTVELSSESLRVPQLIIAGGADKVSGTARPYQYFRKYRDRGAPWAFIVQNGSPHCCTANAKQLILSWLEAVVKERGSRGATPLREVDQRVGWLAFFKPQQTEIADSFGLKTFEATAATIEKIHSGKTTPQGWESAGWLSNHAVASEWLAFVKQEHHPTLPLN